jgi:alpha-tubulin suppressor-like RCC1 family protein
LGTVSFLADGSAIAPCTGMALKLNGSSYEASCSDNSLGAGSHTITATYSGDALYTGSTTTLSGGQTVTATEGVAVGWGLNNLGQLGNETTTNSRVPLAVHLPAGTTVTAVAGGFAHSLALTTTGAVYAWGDNSHGQLGNGTTTSSTAPVAVSLPAGTVVTAIAVGYYDSVALTSTGQIYAWGLNNVGQLGNGSTSDAPSPVLVSLPGGVIATAISAGYVHTLALTTDGTVYAWGANNVGQLGIGTTANSPVPVVVHLPSGTSASAVAAGFAHSLVVTTRRKVLAWGDNAGGELGNGTGTNSPVPVAVSLPSGTAVTAVSGGNFTSSAITSDGAVWAWGVNNAGQLGNGTTTNSPTPVLVGLPSGVVASSITSQYSSMAALTSTGAVYTWGDNTYGQLGNDDPAASSTPVLVHLPTGGHAVAIGGSPYTAATLAIVPAITTATTVSSAPNPSSFTQSVTFTATVSPTDGGATVAFTADGTPLAGCGAVALALAGTAYQATCSVSTLTVGTHAINAAYSGDRLYLGSSGDLADGQTVNRAATSTSVTTSDDPATLGEPVTFTATVTPTDGAGTVAFFADGSATPIAGCGAQPLTLVIALYQATCTTSSLTGGPHTITAVYSGDTSYAPSTGSVTLTVKVHSQLDVATVHVVVSVLQVSVTYRATLTAYPSGTPIAGQTVVFQGAANLSCSGVTDALGVASCKVTVLGVLPGLLKGSYTASYAGNGLYLPSAGTGQVTLL